MRWKAEIKEMNFKKKSSKKLLFFVEKIEFEKIFRKKKSRKNFRLENRKFQLKSHLKSIFGKSILNDFSIEIWIFSKNVGFFKKMSDFFRNFFFDDNFSTEKKYFSFGFFLNTGYILLLSKKVQNRP